MFSLWTKPLDLMVVSAVTILLNTTHLQEIANQPGATRSFHIDTPDAIGLATQIEHNAPGAAIFEFGHPNSARRPRLAGGHQTLWGLHPEPGVDRRHPANLIMDLCDNLIAVHSVAPTRLDFFGTPRSLGLPSIILLSPGRPRGEIESLSIAQSPPFHPATVPVPRYETGPNLGEACAATSSQFRDS